MPYSKFKFAVAHKLKDAGYIKDVNKHGKKTRKCVEVELLYKDNGTPRITGVKRISKPSARIYERADKITSVKYGVIHYGVPNIPSRVPRTASAALSYIFVPRSGRAIIFFSRSFWMSTRPFCKTGFAFTA